MKQRDESRWLLRHAPASRYHMKMARPSRPSFIRIAEWVDTYEDTVPLRGGKRILSLGEINDDEPVVVVLDLHEMNGSICLELSTDLQWIATFSECFDEATLTAPEFVEFATEILAAGRLCEYLQRCTDDYRI